MVLADLRRRGDAIDRARRRVGAAPDTLLLRGDHQRLEAVEVDRLAEALVQLEARVVRDAGAVDAGVHAPEILLELRGITHIAPPHLHPLLRLHPPTLSPPLSPRALSPPPPHPL